MTFDQCNQDIEGARLDHDWRAACKQATLVGLQLETSEAIPDGVLIGYQLHHQLPSLGERVYAWPYPMDDASASRNQKTNRPRAWCGDARRRTLVLPARDL